MDSQGKILVLEDRNNWQEMLRLLLEPEGFQVQVAGDLQQARHFLEMQTYDLAILDVRLDESAEAEPDDVQMRKSLREIRSRQSTVRVLIFSGFGTAHLAREALKDFNVIDFVEKDRFDAQQFKRIVKAAIPQSGARSEEEMTPAQKKRFNELTRRLFRGENISFD